MTVRNYLSLQYAKYRYHLLAGSLLLLFTFFIMSLTDVDDRIWNTVHNFRVNQETRKNSIWLADYQADLVGVELSGISDNVSGVTYDQTRESLWIVVSSPQSLVETDLQFNILRRVELKSFHDTEAIAYAGNGQFVFTDERKQLVVIAKIDSETTLLDRNELRQITLGLNEGGDKGLDGVAVHSASNTIYTVRAGDPMKIVTIAGFVDSSRHINIEDVEQIDIDDLFLDDVSGLHFDTKTNHLLILSSDSSLLVEVDLKGNKISTLELEKGFNNLESSIPEAEGVALDADGNLYIVSEPNLLYRYKKVVGEK